jgi:hypothetical protein
VASEEAKARVKRMVLHAEQVGAGLLPVDSPPDFVRPDTVDERGLPWWFGPDYHPTDRALVEFSKPLGGLADDPTPEQRTFEF